MQRCLNLAHVKCEVYQSLLVGGYYYGKDSMPYMAMFDRCGLIKVLQFVHVQINTSISGVWSRLFDILNKLAKEYENRISMH